MNPWEKMTRFRVLAFLFIMVLAVGVWLWLAVPDLGILGNPGDRADSARVSDNVTYTVRDAQGRIKEQGRVHNAVN
ncbi:MAG: hypothetical protein ACE5Q6_17620, partial [Dehalococcoidia bacterium]